MTHDEMRALYVISVAAELAGMHPQTLRIYERRGLLTPARTTGGNRRYSDADIARLLRITELAATGMNLEGIRHVMSFLVTARSPSAVALTSAALYLLAFASDLSDSAKNEIREIGTH